MSAKKIRKELELSVAATLTAAFTSLAENLSSKKFNRNVKRATKALLTGVKPKKEKKSKKQTIPPASNKHNVTGAIN